MNRVHFTPCGRTDDRARVGRLLAALVAVVLTEEERSAATAAVMVSDHPSRSRVTAQWDAWTTPLHEALTATGWRLTPTPSPRVAGPTAGELPTAGSDLKIFPVGAETAGADALISVSRVSLHEKSGLEGVLHGLAVGCASVDGLAMIQAAIQPKVERDLCGGCGMCVTYCGNEGIRHNGHVAVVRPENCLGCGDCLAECFMDALKFPSGGSEALMRRKAEAAAAVADRFRGRSIHAAVVIPEPERRSAMEGHHVPQPEAGLLVGFDPLAVECAAADLVEASLGAPLGESCRCPVDPRSLLAHGIANGMGDGTYRRIDHSPDTLAC